MTRRTKRQQKVAQAHQPAGTYHTAYRRDGRAVRVFVPTGR